MSDAAIQVENLGKQYRIGQRERYQALRDTLTDAISAPFRVIRNLRRSAAGNPPSDNFIWALKDVSLEIKRGEAVGIIGRNGVGKSTFLKILARITEPTEGEARIRGRVGSLLEVGTGFHPELTGRENIYLNGAILGMKRTEIARKFDEIVAFAEIVRFLDTPVKHYSSGMYMRLAFAVAAHLEPEILLVDEVLAVGDAAFQKKCLGKMGEVAKQGRTVLFVSHNIGAITQLCPQTIWLNNGKVEVIGQSDAVVRAYLSENSLDLPDVRFDLANNPNSPMIITRCWLADPMGNPIATVDVNSDLAIGLTIVVRQETQGADAAMRVYNSLAQLLFTTTLSTPPNILPSLLPGEHTFLIQIPKTFLAPDRYSLTVALHRPNVAMFDLREHLLSFQVEESGSAMWQYRGSSYGNILVRFPWQHTPVLEK